MIASLNYNVPPPLFPISSARTKRSAADAASNAIAQEWTQLASGYWQGHDTAEAYFNAHIDDIFALRIKATNWLMDNPQKDSDAALALIGEMGEVQVDPSRALLYDNLLFAIRVNRRSLRDLTGNASVLSSQSIPHLPQIGFKEYMGLVSMTVPDAMLPPFVDWFTASLRIEFSTSLTFVLEAERLEPDKVKVEELATFVAEAGQEFGAVTKELTSPKHRNRATPSSNLPADLMEENQLLAELDLETFSDL